MHLSNKFSILIVDDIESNIYALGELIKRYFDVEIFTATSGEDALRLTIETNIDLILLDIQMPIMNGFEVAEYLQSNNQTKKIPIIFITANSTDETNIIHGYEIGAVDYILKPIDDFILISKLKQYIQLYFLQKELDYKNKLLLNEKDALLNVQSAGLFSLHEKTFKWVNYTLTFMLGYAPEEIVGKNIGDFFSNSQEYESFSKIIDDINLNSKSSQLEITLQNKNKERIYLLSNFTPINCSNNEVVGIVIDISEKKQQEQLLREQKEEFESLFKTSKDGIAILDLESNFLEFNDSYLEMTGYSRSELLSKSCIDLAAEEYVEQAKYILAEVITNGFVQNFEKVCITKDNKRVFTNMALALLPDKRRILISTKDITKQKQYEEHLHDLVNQETAIRVEKERLLLQQSKMAMMGEMIGAIGHQWRQPLSALGVRIEDVVTAYDFGEIDKEYIDKFKTKSMALIKKMSDTIDDFRNFFKPVKDKSYFYIADAVDETLKILSHQLKDHGIQVSINIQNKSTPNVLFGYQNELEQAIMILLSNAQDALIENKIKKRKIEITISSTEQNRMLLSVHDNAGGIAMEIIDKIFEPYFTTKSNDKGTGIGLYIAKEIVERQMNGVLSVKNIDNGALFSIEI